MPEKRRRLAVSAAAMDADLRTAARLARGAGFDALQLDARQPSADILSLSHSGRRELLAVLRAGDLDLVGLRFDLGGKGFGPKADVDAALDRLQEVFQAAAGLQSPLVCVEIGPLPAPLSEEKPRPAISPDQAGAIIVDFAPPARSAPEATGVARKFDAALAASVDGALAELGRRADRHGVMVAFRSDLAAFAALERALKAAACPWFGVDLDPVALLHDEWPADEIFSRLGGRIRHVRARDAILGADRRTKPALIGQGSVDWPAFLAALDDAGYRGWITVDPIDLPHRHAAATAGAAALQKLLAQ